MKTPNKALFILLVSLMALSAIASPAFAQSTNLTATATITATNDSVGGESSFTFTIQNTGSANLGSANITVPFGPTGYHTIRNIAITQQPTSQNWNITLSGDGAFILLLGSGNGLSTDQSVSFSFDAVNPQAEASYIWTV